MNGSKPHRLSEGEARLLTLLDDMGTCGQSAATLLRRAGLPGVRTEGWRWSDLRSAVNAQTPIVMQHDYAHDVEPSSSGTETTSNDIMAELAASLSSPDPADITEGELNERTGAAIRSVAVKSGQTVVIERIGADTGLSAGAFRAIVKGGSLTRIVIQDGPEGSVCLNQANVVVGPNGQYNQFTLAFGGKLTRLETKLEIWDGGTATINAAYLVNSGRHCDITTFVTAEGPGRPTDAAVGAHCDQVIKGVARKGGRGVFQGKIVVQRPAQKSEARQRHQALMLEQGAEIFAKPELQIFADDVQCSHGNTVGAIDEQALFYMRTRGMPEQEARALLVEAFLAEAIPESFEDAWRDEILSRMRGWLNADAQ